MQKYTILSNENIKGNFYKIIFEVEDTSKFIPGQFVNVGVGNKDGKLLKRPISVYEVSDTTISLIYEIRGGGTKLMSEFKAGDKTEVLFFLGNGFDVKDYKRIMVIGGGVGTPPLYSVIKNNQDKEFKAYLGFGNKDKVILEEEYKALCDTVVATDDGSYGKKGYVTDFAVEDIKSFNPDLIISCGPKVMYNKLKDLDIDVFVSLEERMGCGFGACLVCVCDTIHGKKRVCKDGPVFDIKELIL